MKRFLLVAAILALAVSMKKKCSQQRDRWQGLSEADARERLDHRIPSRMPDQRRAAMTDKIIGRMRGRGMLIDDLDPDSADDDSADSDTAADDITDADVDIDPIAQPVEIPDDVSTLKV